MNQLRPRDPANEHGFEVQSRLGPTRLGVCSAPPCRQAYVDTSPNQSRRYCSERCSSRANVAAYRARQKAAAG